jgi:hypothetical protein
MEWLKWALLWKEYGYLPPDELSWDQVNFLVSLEASRAEEVSKQQRDAKLRTLIRESQ